MTKNFLLLFQCQPNKEKAGAGYPRGRHVSEQLIQYTISVQIIFLQFGHQATAANDRPLHLLQKTHKRPSQTDTRTSHLSLSFAYTYSMTQTLFLGRILGSSQMISYADTHRPTFLHSPPMRNLCPAARHLEIYDCTFAFIGNAPTTATSRRTMMKTMEEMRQMRSLRNELSVTPQQLLIDRDTARVKRSPPTRLEKN